MDEIILASASPRRNELFQMMGISCQIDPSGTEEIIDTEIGPSDNVCRLADQKAEDVALRHQNSVIIAADTIVVKDGTILGKPESSTDAARMLRLLSNQHHFVYSGVAVLLLGENTAIIERITFYEKTKVTFSSLNESEISKYIATGSPMDKAGAYGIQDDYGSLFIKKIEGDYYNVVGFPVNKFYQTLKSEFPVIFKKVFNI